MGKAKSEQLDSAMAAHHQPSSTSSSSASTLTTGVMAKLSGSLAADAAACSSTTPAAASETKHELTNGGVWRENGCGCPAVSAASSSSLPPSLPLCSSQHQDSISIPDRTPDLCQPVLYEVYQSELQMPDIMQLIQKDLSEPYSIYTYRYFIHNWPHLCFMARVGAECVGAIVCKLDYHKKVFKRGYIAMLAVDQNFRKRKIGSTLVKKAIDIMIAEEADEVVLETEVTNKPALMLYENLGFVRDKRLFRYYLNGVDALRLKLWLR